jgi:hypothetical protein
MTDSVTNDPTLCASKDYQDSITHRNGQLIGARGVILRGSPVADYPQDDGLTVAEREKSDRLATLSISCGTHIRHYGSPDSVSHPTQSSIR